MAYSSDGNIDHAESVYMYMGTPGHLRAIVIEYSNAQMTADSSAVLLVLLLAPRY